MGLDIVAYEKITLAPDATESDYDYGLNSLQTFYVEDDRPQSAGIISGAFYEVSGREHSFRAGSYSGYNSWRNKLSVFALGISAPNVWKKARQGDNELVGKPFVELIDFSDCGGTLGPAACAKLAKDFEGHLEEAEARFSGMANYRDFMKAFQLASSGGCVRFC